MRAIGFLLSGLVTSIFLYLTINAGTELQSVWSSLLGVSLSVFVALVALDPFQAMLERRRWAKARTLVYPMLISQLENLGSESLINLSSYLSHRHLGSFNSNDAFDTWVSDTEKAIKNNGYSNKLSDEIVNLIRHPDVVWSLDEIRRLQIPRLYLISPNCKAVELSLAFEKACSDLIDSVIGHERVVTGAPAGSYLKLVKAARDLYGSLISEKYS